MCMKNVEKSFSGVNRLTDNNRFKKAYLIKKTGEINRITARFVPDIDAVWRSL